MMITPICDELVRINMDLDGKRELIHSMFSGTIDNLYRGDLKDLFKDCNIGKRTEPIRKGSKTTFTRITFYDRFSRRDLMRFIISVPDKMYDTMPVRIYKHTYSAYLDRTPGENSALFELEFRISDMISLFGNPCVHVKYVCEFENLLRNIQDYINIEFSLPGHEEALKGFSFTQSCVTPEDEVDQKADIRIDFKLNNKLVYTTGIRYMKPPIGTIGIFKPKSSKHGIHDIPRNINSNQRKIIEGVNEIIKHYATTQYL